MPKEVFNHATHTDSFCRLSHPHAALNVILEMIFLRVGDGGSSYCLVANAAEQVEIILPEKCVARVAGKKACHTFLKGGNWSANYFEKQRLSWIKG